MKTFFNRIKLFFYRLTIPFLAFRSVPAAIGIRFIFWILYPYVCAKLLMNADDDLPITLSRIILFGPYAILLIVDIVSIVIRKTRPDIVAKFRSLSYNLKTAKVNTQKARAEKRAEKDAEKMSHREFTPEEQARLDRATALGVLKAATKGVIMGVGMGVIGYISYWVFKLLYIFNFISSIFRDLGLTFITEDVIVVIHIGMWALLALYCPIVVIRATRADAKRQIYNKRREDSLFTEYQKEYRKVYGSIFGQQFDYSNCYYTQDTYSDTSNEETVFDIPVDMDENDTIFRGLSMEAATKLFREKLRSVHPDNGGSVAACIKLMDEWHIYKATHTET